MHGRAYVERYALIVSVCVGVSVFYRKDAKTQSFRSGFFRYSELDIACPSAGGDILCAVLLSPLHPILKDFSRLAMKSVRRPNFAF